MSSMEEYNYMTTEKMFTSEWLVDACHKEASVESISDSRVSRIRESMNKDLLFDDTLAQVKDTGKLQPNSLSPQPRNKPLTNRKQVIGSGFKNVVKRKAKKKHMKFEGAQQTMNERELYGVIQSMLKRKINKQKFNLRNVLGTAKDFFSKEASLWRRSFYKGYFKCHSNS